MDVPKPQVIEGPDGLRTIISFKFEGGKKIKMIQKVREIRVVEKVNRTIAERRRWAKYGAETNAAPGPNLATTKLGEEVILKLSPPWKEGRDIEEEKDKDKADVEKSLYVCRVCGMPGHFTSKCPFRELLGEMGGDEGEPGADGPGASTGTADPASAAVAAAPMSSIPGKYVPPSRRVGGRDPSSDAYKDQRERDDARTIKITQLNESADEAVIVSNLLTPFQTIPRIAVVRNKETGRSRGIAYVTFDSEYDAENAIRLLDGRGFMNLILHAEWSKPKK